MVIAANQYHRVYYVKTPQNPTAISREAYTHNILFGNTHHLHDLLYMPQHTFSSLSDWLLNNTSLKDLREISTVQKLLIFISTSTISSYNLFSLDYTAY